MAKKNAELERRLEAMLSWNKQKNWRKLGAEASVFIKKYDDRSDGYFYRATALRHLEQYENAINDFDRAIELDPKNPKAYHHRGITKYKLGKYEEAINDFDKTIELNPKSTRAYNNRAIAKGELGKHEEAIKDYDKAIELDPDYSYAYNNRGSAKDELGEYKEAIIDYNEAIESDPNNPSYFHNRAITVGKLRAEIATTELTQTYNDRLAEFVDPNKIIAFHEKRITQSSLRLYGIDIYREQNEGEGIKEDFGITAGQIIKYGFWFLRYRLNYPTLYLFILWAITLIIFYCLDFLNNCNAQYPYFCSALLFFLPSLILSVPLIIWILKNYTEQGKTKDDNDSTPEAPFLGRINRGYMGHAERASSRYRYAILMVWIGVSVLFYRYYFNSSKELVEELSLQDVLLFATTLAITTSPFRFHINFIARRADEELIRLDSYIRERNMMLFWNAQRQDKNEANKAHLTAKMFDHIDKNSAAEISLQMMKSRKFNWRLNQNKKECDKADDNNKRDQTADLADLLRAIKNLTPPKAE